MNTTATSSAFSIWLQAIRPRTLPLAASAIFLGFCLAPGHDTSTFVVFVLALITALLLQVLSNLANDYGDAVAGTDDSDRLGPARMVGSGLATPKAMLRAVALCACAAILSGSTLLFTAAWGRWMVFIIFLSLGAASIAAAILYTVGKRPYGYYGLGDIMAGLFFGPVPVWGMAVLCGAPFAPYLLLPGIAAGICSAMVLNINNMRDMDTDKRAGKMTVAVRLGPRRAAIYHTSLCILTGLCWGLFWFFEDVARLPALLLSTPLGISSYRAVEGIRDGANMNRQLKNTVLCSALVSTGMGLIYIVR